MREYRIIQQDEKYHVQYRDLRSGWPAWLTPWMAFYGGGGYGEFVGGILSWEDQKAAEEWLKQERANPIPFNGRRVVG